MKTLQLLFKSFCILFIMAVGFLSMGTDTIDQEASGTEQHVVADTHDVRFHLPYEIGGNKGVPQDTRLPHQLAIGGQQAPRNGGGYPVAVDIGGESQSKPREPRPFGKSDTSVSLKCCVVSDIGGNKGAPQAPMPYQPLSIGGQCPPRNGNPGLGIDSSEILSS
ncbi:MAG: hypothetical protein EOO51_08460 [Flavobacterium sp.]|nr:MAG: hypothetical protein EOO51_08460 [Flavobacterium sp.]